jgi:hypothetical protein
MVHGIELAIIQHNYTLQRSTDSWYLTDDRTNPAMLVFSRCLDMMNLGKPAAGSAASAHRVFSARALLCNHFTATRSLHLHLSLHTTLTSHLRLHWRNHQLVATGTGCSAPTIHGCVELYTQQHPPYTVHSHE